VTSRISARPAIALAVDAEMLARGLQSLQAASPGLSLRNARSLRTNVGLSTPTPARDGAEARLPSRVIPTAKTTPPFAGCWADATQVFVEAVFAPAAPSPA